MWTFHSRTQCLSCHNAWSEYTLAFNVAQLNRANIRNPLLKNGSRNSLIKLSREGYIRRVDKDDNTLPVFDDESAGKESSLPGRENTRAGNAENREFTTEERARGYLHVNCAHCHRFGGGGGQVVLELDYSKPLKETGILDVRPKQGDFGIPDARILAPGDPTRSVLFYRMAKFGRGRMPHIGSEVPDWDGLKLMNLWIASMGKGKDLLVPSKEEIEKDLKSPHTALPLAYRFNFRRLGSNEATTLLAAAAKLEPGPVRDLFEGYLTPDPRGRKLGSNPRPHSILALSGDAKNGEVIFNNKEMKCANCHKVGDKGVSLGPDLTAIGKTRTRAELLESLLQPSVRVEPQYAAYLVQTKDEKTFTGLLVKRDERQVVLRDAENKEIVLDAANVESVRPSRLSLMPDGQMSGLLPQEAADLLEYLVQRK